jgi:hypothetical protein
MRSIVVQNQVFESASRIAEVLAQPLEDKHFHSGADLEAIDAGCELRDLPGNLRHRSKAPPSREFLKEFKDKEVRIIVNGKEKKRRNSWTW